LPTLAPCRIGSREADSTCASSRPTRAGILVLLGAALCLLPAAARAISFQGIGFLPGAVSSGASGVSADGSVVVGGSAGEAFLWTATGGMVGLGGPPGRSRTSASGVSADGSTVVGSAEDPLGILRGDAFRWTSAGGIQALGVVGAPVAPAPIAAVSGDGSVVVGTTDSGVYEAYVWTAGSGLMTLGPLPGDTSTGAAAVSDDGSIVAGWSADALSSEATLWTEATGLVGLGSVPGGSSSGAYGISPDGAVVVGWAQNAAGITEAARWTAATGMQALGSSPAYSIAFDASEDGSLVVGFVEGGAGGTTAFIWDETLGMRSLQSTLTNAGLDLTGWTLTSAEAISADGSTIVGSGIDPDGRFQGWVAVIPEPDTGLLVLGGLLGLARRRRAAIAPPTPQGRRVRVGGSSPRRLATRRRPC